MVCFRVLRHHRSRRCSIFFLLLVTMRYPFSFPGITSRDLSYYFVFIVACVHCLSSDDILFCKLIMAGERSRFRRNFCTAYVFAWLVSKTNFLRISKDRITTKKKINNSADARQSLLLDQCLRPSTSNAADYLLFYIRVTLIRLLRAMCVYKLYEVTNKHCYAPLYGLLNRAFWLL